MMTLVFSSKTRRLKAVELTAVDERKDPIARGDRVASVAAYEIDVSLRVPIAVAKLHASHVGVSC